MSLNRNDKQDKENIKYIETTLDVKLGIRGEFVWNGVPLRYYWYAYNDSKEPVMLHVDECASISIKQKHNTVQDLCKYLIKKKDSIVKRYRQKAIADDIETRNEQELVIALNNTKSKRKINYDGQNILIKTGKDPILVKMILDAIERYEADQEAIGLIYK